MHETLQSKKKVCTQERLVKTLSAIGDLGITSEGQGGKTAYYGCDYEVGTGLRAPDMPFYYKPRLSRQAVLKHLEDQGLITVSEHDIEGWEGLKITDMGITVLKSSLTCTKCGTKKEWYHTCGFVQTGEKSGISTHARQLYCACDIKAFNKRNKLGAGILRASNMLGLGKKIKSQLEVEPMSHTKIIDQFLAHWKEKATDYYNRMLKLADEKREAYESVPSGSTCPPHPDYYNYSKEKQKELTMKRRELWKTYDRFRQAVKLLYNIEFPINKREEKLGSYLDKEVERKKKNLILRIEKKAGKIVDGKDIHIGDDGEINGVIHGETAIVNVRTISAGGYNIQCFHYRVLVKEVKA
jgi:hypothetical protein